jgi:hypothetical protein
MRNGELGVGVALVSILDAKRLNPRDLGIVSLKGSWVARELGSLETEKELLTLADAYLDDALRRGLTKGDPGMVIYLLGEINRRRGEYLRGRETLTFLGNNPRTGTQLCCKPFSLKRKTPRHTGLIIPRIGWSGIRRDSKGCSPR